MNLYFLLDNFVITTVLHFSTSPHYTSSRMIKSSARGQGTKKITYGTFLVATTFNILLSPTTTTTSINYIVQRDQSKTDLGKYLHGCAFSPVISTFQKAIKRNNFITWPGIDNINFSKAVGMTSATAKDHLDQERKYLQSTKQIPEVTTKDEDTSPSKIPSKTRNCFTTIISAPEKNMTYSDQTGRFPYQSSRGTQIYIVYDYDSNAILHAPLKVEEQKKSPQHGKNVIKD